MKAKASDYLIYDESTGTYREDPEQRVRDDVEKHYWLHVGRTIIKDWRLYVMLLPMLLVFLFWRYFPMLFQEIAGWRRLSFRRVLESLEKYFPSVFLWPLLRFPSAYSACTFLQRSKVQHCKKCISGSDISS